MDEPVVNLPQKIYLLAHDPQRGRPTKFLTLDRLLTAAALAELLLRGLVRDADGTAEVQRARLYDPAALAGLDPFSARVLGELRRTERPLTWRWWIRATNVRTSTLEGFVRASHQVRDGLADATATDWTAEAREELAARVRQALRGPVDEVAPEDAALVALLAAGRVHTALGSEDRREFKGRIEALSSAAGPLPKEFTRAVVGTFAFHAVLFAALEA